MFAKEKCGYSRRANEILQQRLQIDTKDICIVGNPNSNDRGYLCAEKWQFINSNEELKAKLVPILDIWDAEYTNATFPQVFIHAHPRWYYVGGCDELETMSTAANTQESDLLHLLPLGREGRRTPPTQLKF